ncbi:hypothetical protein [Nonomuraea sp. WAC 01424]|nr:hypothetical protein [Nonomuraea sp. WAC 01424]
MRLVGPPPESSEFDTADQRVMQAEMGDAPCLDLTDALDRRDEALAARDQ